jgi:predicted nucleotidyltransferase
MGGVAARKKTSKMPWERRNLPFSQIIPQLVPIILGSIDKDMVQKIYLFGSYAYGKPDKESDLDICVILDNYEKYHCYYVDISLAMMDKGIVNKDLLVYKEKEFYSSENPKGIEHTIIAQGVLLYERKNIN